jgi:imidazole glycerol-phosphate synthase subunit HisH
MLALIDIQSGNLHSVENALRAAGCEDLVVTADPDRVRAADRIVLPGVGAFATCATNLFAVDGLREALDEAVLERGTPFLGICVGMQLLADRGEEGEGASGLGWIGGTVRRIPSAPDRRVPHMGWNDVRPVGTDGLVEAGEAYFLHSYGFDADDPSDVAAWTNHGEDVAAAVERGPILGVQFHPEKSQRYGIDLLRSFLAWRP